MLEICLRERSKHTERKRRQWKTDKAKKKTRMFSQKGLLKKEKKQRWNFEREENRKIRRKAKKKRRTLKKGGFWGTEDKKTPKLQENGLFCLVQNKEKPENQKPNQNQTTNQKREGLKTFWMLKLDPHFLLHFVTSKSLQKLRFAESTIKIMFSAEHSFCGSQIVKTPSRGPSQNTLFQTDCAFWVFPCARWNPYSCSVLWFYKKKKTKNDVTFFQTETVNENAL